MAHYIVLPATRERGKGRQLRVETHGRHGPRKGSPCGARFEKLNVLSSPSPASPLAPCPHLLRGSRSLSAARTAPPILFPFGNGSARTLPARTASFFVSLFYFFVVFDRAVVMDADHPEQIFARDRDSAMRDARA